MPYQEVAHTADWCLRVWSDTLPSLFAEAARGMYALAGVQTMTLPKKEIDWVLEGSDNESLLVEFLSNLVYQMEYERMAFSPSSIQVETNRVTARMQGTRIISITKAIKAVTFHNLAIINKNRGYEVSIVFDV